MSRHIVYICDSCGVNPPADEERPGQWIELARVANYARDTDPISAPKHFCSHLCLERFVSAATIDGHYEDLAEEPA